MDNNNHYNDNGESKIKTELQPTSNIIHNFQSESYDMDHNFSLDSILSKEDDYEILSQRMDIREPLSTLKTLLEQKLDMKLSDYSFCLQDCQLLESHKNLVDQCVQGEGLVQINIQLKQRLKQINIVDVLKPAEDYLDIVENNISISNSEDNKNIIRWTVDAQYKKDQERLKIPADPREWSQTHVKHWLQWAVRQFNLVSLKLADWNISGAQLCNLTLEEFQAKVPLDPGDVFWTHLELLKKCKLVAVVQKNSLTINTSLDKREKSKHQKFNKHRSFSTNSFINTDSIFKSNFEATSFVLATSSKTINAGQIQLWQFLLELLTDQEHKHAIQWLGTEGEFKLNQPEAVAQLWGARKNKPSMNYEKLSRALRYYYDGDMISKVHGKRFVYKFVCDLKQLLGYSAAELSNLVNNQQYFT